jgi:hypothetical protein
MTKRYIPVLAVLACLSVAGGPAFATDDPPQSPPATDTTPTTAAPDTTPASPGTTPAACVDTTRPRSRVLTSSRAAVRSHALRGTAVDAGCKGGSVALVTVSIALKHGKHCQYLTRSARLGRSSTCKSPRWLSATGTKHWRLSLPRHMQNGSYQILTRAVDSAGNVERAHARRLAIRQPRSTTTKK